MFPPIFQITILMGLGCVSAPGPATSAALESGSDGAPENAHPVIRAITLSPGEVPTDGLIAASVEVDDAEGDDVILSYAWHVDGALVDVSGRLLDGAWFDKGQTITVEVTPIDAGGAGEPVMAGDVSVINTPPTAPILNIGSSPRAGLDDLVCGVLVPAADLDDDLLEYRFTWRVDGVIFEGATDSVLPGDTVPAAAILPYTNWRCEVSASDGESEGPSRHLEIASGLAYTGWSAHEVELSDADYALAGAQAYDQSGYALAGAGDVDGDGLADLIIGAPDSDAGPDDGGAAYLVTGASLADVDGPDSLGDLPILLGPSAEAYAGSAVDGAGDVDGDGLADLIIGAPGVGAAFLLRGSVALAQRDLDLASDADRLAGVGADAAGNSVAGAGDVDGDGLDDVLVGAWWDDDGGHKAGRTYLVSGASLGPAKVALADADASWRGEDASNWSGYSVDGAGDVDGDGLDDVLIGAPYNDDAGFRAGKSYLVLGSSVDGWADLAEADYTFLGEVEEDNSGAVVAGAGDIDGDGRADLLISAQDNDAGKVSAGRTYLVLAGALADADSLRGAWPLTGDGENLSSGSAVAGVGDLDGDGLGEILVGAVGRDRYRGGAYLLFGAWFDHHEGELHLDDAEYLFAGERSGDFAGYAVAGPGDVDGDGRPDLLIGAYANDDAGENAGKSYLVLSP